MLINYLGLSKMLAKHILKHYENRKVCGKIPMRIDNRVEATK